MGRAKHGPAIRYGPCQARPVTPSSSPSPRPRLQASIARGPAVSPSPWTVNQSVGHRSRPPPLPTPHLLLVAVVTSPPRSCPARPPSRGTQPLPSLSLPSPIVDAVRRAPPPASDVDVGWDEPLLLHLSAPPPDPRAVGPLCFDIGSKPSTARPRSLVASHIAAWPPPTPGSPMDLPIGGAALRVHLPSSSIVLAAASSPPPPMVGRAWHDFERGWGEAND